MPSRRKKRGGLEVAGLRGKKRRLGGTDHLAQAELGVAELTTDKVGAGVGGMSIVRLHRTTMCSTVCYGTGVQLRPSEEKR